jgi:hypothetical protein
MHQKILKMYLEDDVVSLDFEFNMAIELFSFCCVYMICICFMYVVCVCGVCILYVCIYTLDYSFLLCVFFGS